MWETTEELGMSATDYVFEEVIDLVASQYGLCVKKARELFTEESAIQSASATMFINATKEKSTVVNLTNQLKQKIATLNKEAIPSATSVWNWHFKDLIDELGGRITSYIKRQVERNYTPEEIEQHVKEYSYFLRCEKLNTVEEQNQLAEQMFGKEAVSQKKNRNRVEVVHSVKELKEKADKSPVFTDLDEGVSGLVEEDWDGYGLDDL